MYTRSSLYLKIRTNELPSKQNQTVKKKQTPLLQSYIQGERGAKDVRDKNNEFDTGNRRSLLEKQTRYRKPHAAQKKKKRDETERKVKCKDRQEEEVFSSR